MRRDPLNDPEPLIRRIYSYVAYRLGDGPQAEDVTSEVFERALRYRESYDDRRGGPAAWLVGIARRCVDDALAAGVRDAAAVTDVRDVTTGTTEEAALTGIVVRDAVARLPLRERELVALRYGADLSAARIGEVLGMRTNAVEVALHRVLARLRAELASSGVRDRPDALAHD